MIDLFESLSIRARRGCAADAHASAGALRRGPLADRTDFYRTNARQRPARRKGQGLVEIFDIDEHVAAEILARLSERPVGQEALAVAHPHRRSCRRRMKRVTAQVLPPRREFLRGPYLTPVGVLALGQAALVPGLVEVHQQQIFHTCLHQLVERDGPGSTAGADCLPRRRRRGAAMARALMGGWPRRSYARRAVEA